MEAAPLRVLTVGDGDLSYSLALARAYGDRILLTATVLPTAEELVATYANAAACVEELRARGATVLHGVDATALAEHSEPRLGPQDAVVFNHPHLGLADLKETVAHARRHGVLVAHFLRSAADVLMPGGSVHLTLCGNQPKVWCAEEHAVALGFEQAQSTPTSTAQFSALGAPPPAEAGWTARRRFRVGGLGSRHWLGAYGYEHRRTQSDADMRVDNSVELVFRWPGEEAAAAVAAAAAAAGSNGGKACGDDGAVFRCAVCRHEFGSAAALASHVRDLALPDVWLTAAPPPPRAVVGGGETAASAGADACGGVAVPPQHACEYCGEAFGSRNRLFAHLKQKCAPAVARAQQPLERVVLAVGYTGEAFHGSYHAGGGGAAEESERPSVEGRVLGAARLAWGEENVEAISGLVRTERGAHAAEALLVLTVRTGSALGATSDSADATDATDACASSASSATFATSAAAAASTTALERLREALAPEATLLAPPHRVPSTAVERLRGGIKRQVYAYAIPYAALLTEEERTAAAAAATAAAAAARRRASGGGDADATRDAEAAATEKDDEEQGPPGVWISNVPLGLWTRPDLTPNIADGGEEGVRALLRHHGFGGGFGFGFGGGGGGGGDDDDDDASRPRVTLPSCGGYVEVELRDDATVRACVAALDGSEWAGRRLVVVCRREAAMRMGVHRRIKATIRGLTAGAAAPAVAKVSAEVAPATTAEEVVGVGTEVEEDDKGAPPPAKRGKAAAEAAATPKAAARSYHNFTTEKGIARSGQGGAHHVARAMLRSCTWGIAGDLRPSAAACDGGDGGGGCDGGWATSDWVVLRFAAKAFAPQQVRRMAGVVAAIVSGRRPAEYLEQCFAPAPTPTPLLPAEQVWLAELELLPASEGWRREHLTPRHDALEAVRARVEAQVTAGGVAAWLRTASPAFEAALNPP